MCSAASLSVFFIALEKYFTTSFENESWEKTKHLPKYLSYRKIHGILYSGVNNTHVF